MSRRLALLKPASARSALTQSDFLYAERRLRPLARRRFNTARPPLVDMRERKPWVRLRLRTLGWNVLFIAIYPVTLWAWVLVAQKNSATHFPTRKKVGYSIEMWGLIQSKARYFYHSTGCFGGGPGNVLDCASRRYLTAKWKNQLHSGLQPSTHIFSLRYTQVIHRKKYPTTAFY